MNARLIQLIPAIDYIKTAKSIEIMKQRINNLYSNKLLSQRLFNMLYPSEIRKEASPFSKVNFNNEFIYYSLMLNQEFKILNEFIKQKEKYEYCYLCGRYSDAKEVLDLIEQKFGQSIWLIKQRLLIIEAEEGTDIQKIYRQKYIQNDNISILDKIDITLYGLQIEKNMTAGLYEFLFRKAGSNIIEYCSIRNNFYGENDFSDICNIIYHGNNYRIIDMLQTHIKVCQYLYAFMDDQSLLKKCLKLTKNICDTRLLNLRTIVLNELDTENINTNAIRILDQYTYGHYENVVEMIEKEITSGNIFGEYLELLAKIQVKLNIKDKKSDNQIIYIINNMKTILKKEKNYQNAIENLRKIRNELQDFSFAGRIDSFIYEYTIYERPHSGELNIPTTFIGNPFQGHFIAPRNRENFFTKISSKIEESITFKLYRILYNNNIPANDIDLLDIPNERKLKFKAKKNYRLSLYKEAEKLYYELYRNKDKLARETAFKGILKSKVKLADYNEAVNLIGEHAISNEYELIGYPIGKLISKMENDIMCIPWNNINLSITYYIYCKLYTREKHTMLGISCDKFLRSNDVEKPSELQVNIMPKDSICFFLKNVCTLDVLDQSYAYSGVDDLQKERISICQKLITLDKNNEKIYTKEIRDLTEDIEIKKNIRKMESGKICINTIAMKESLRKVLEPYFIHYITLKDNPEMRKIIDIMEKIGEIEGKTIDYSIIGFNDERKEFFNLLYMEFLHSFTTAEYGLDNILSTEIRHGIFQSKLRKPFEDGHLITVREGSHSTYMKNRYWEEKLRDNLSEKFLNKLLELLNRLSEQIDNLIEEIRQEYIQIKTDNNNKELGVYDFRFNKQKMKDLNNETACCLTFDQFAERLFNHFWEIVDQGKDKMEQILDEIIKDKLYLTLDDIVEEIRNEGLSNQCSELINAITKAKTDLQYTLNHIKKWFEKAIDLQIDDFNINLPIKIGLHIINNTNPSRKIQHRISGEVAKKIKGKYLRFFVDIMYILLENTVKHSYVYGNNLETTFNFEIDEQNIKMCVVNRVNLSKITSDEHEFLRKLRDSIINDKVELERVQSEGGSGFFKISKILKYDLKCPQKLNFGYKNDSFYVEIFFDVKAVCV